MRSTGHARSPMVATLVTVLLNTSLGYCLVFGVGPLPELGVAGAGWATLVTAVLKAVILLAQVLVQHRLVALGAARQPARSGAAVLVPLFVLAVPLGITELFWTTGTFLYNVVFQRLGDDALAAAQIAATLEGVFIVGSIGLMSATTALVGRSVGRGDARRRWRGCAGSRGSGLHTGVGFGVLFAAAAPSLLGLLYGNAGRRRARRRGPRHPHQRRVPGGQGAQHGARRRGAAQRRRRPRRHPGRRRRRLRGRACRSRWCSACTRRWAWRACSSPGSSRRCAKVAIFTLAHAPAGLAPAGHRLPGARAAGTCSLRAGTSGTGDRAPAWDTGAVTGEAGMPGTLSTVGHGTLGRAELGALLQAHGIGQLVDVRRFPGSRRHPDLSRDALAGWLPGLGIGYRWEERLGGRRRLPAGEPVVDTWWTVPAFAAYAAHTRSEEFRAGMDQLVDEAASAAVAVLCSETVWWRCHRRLVADVATLARGLPVRHLMHCGPAGRAPTRGRSAGARRRAGRLGRSATGMTRRRRSGWRPAAELSRSRPARCSARRVVPVR